jgi:uncharacterized protein (TIGR03118 family)
MRKGRYVALAATAVSILTLAACGGYGGGGGGGYGGGGNGGNGGYNSSSSSAMTAYKTTALVSDQAGVAANMDPNLQNGWGVAFNPQGFVWVADNGTGKSTLYDGNGIPQGLVVTIASGTAGSPNPTGIVFNDSTTNFMLTSGGLTGKSPFLFAGEAGTISAWSPAVNGTQALTVVDSASTGAIYKGLAILTGSVNRLYAADFHNKRIDVFDGSFNRITVSGGFTDSAIPSNYGPFNITAIGGQLYVAYAETTPGSGDETKGAGLGYVDVFDSNGTLVKHLVSNGALNAPWGMAMAPANFGSFSNDLLVGNFGDGKINVYDPASGAWLGVLSKADGTAITIDGLWGIAFGNGLDNQPTNTLFYAAGPSDEAHGLYGRIDMQ